MERFTRPGPAGQRASSARRWIAAAMLIGLAVLLGFAWRRHLPPGPTEVRSHDRSAAQLSSDTPGKRAVTMHPRGERDPLSPIVDAIEVAKREVCRGEENLVTVRAHAPDGADEYLTYGVLGEPDLYGPRIPFVAGRSKNAPMQIYIRGKRGASTVADVPQVVQKDCDAPPRVEIRVHREASIPDRAWLMARITDPAALSGAVEYEWVFGFGHRQTTVTTEVEHSYEERRQTTHYSYFVVTVIARAGGRNVTGSRSVRFINFGFTPLVRDDHVTVFAAIDTRSDTSTTMRGWLYHGHPSAVHLTRIKVTTEGRGKGEVEEPAVEQDAAALLGVSELPPGESQVMVDLAPLRPSAPGTTRTFQFTGRSADGKAVGGSFVLVAPTGAVALGSPEEKPDQAKEKKQ
jgi:hypothetical protein